MALIKPKSARVNTPKPDVHRIEICGLKCLHLSPHVERAVPPRAANCASLTPLAIGAVGGPLPHIGPHVIYAVDALLGSPRRRGTWPRISVTRIGSQRALARGPWIGSTFLPWSRERLAQFGKACGLPFCLRKWGNTTLLPTWAYVALVNSKRPNNMYFITAIFETPSAQRALA